MEISFLLLAETTVLLACVFLEDLSNCLLKKIASLPFKIGVILIGVAMINVDQYFTNIVPIIAHQHNQNEEKLPSSVMK